MYRVLEPDQQLSDVDRLRSLAGQGHALVAQQVEAVRTARAHGVTEAAIADALGLHRNTVRYRYGRLEGVPRGRLVDSVRVQVSIPTQSPGGRS